MKPCPDCKATPGLYVGLFQTEKCRTCDGTALVPEEKQAPAPKPFDPSDYLGSGCMTSSGCKGAYWVFHDEDDDSKTSVVCAECYEPPPEYLQHEQVRFTVGFAMNAPALPRLIKIRNVAWWRAPITHEWYVGPRWAIGQGAEYATPGPEPTDALPLVHLETVEEFRAFASHFGIEIVE